ncbi:hypothetical protein BDV26DRAFT_286617 [Aspergillus bertholletiae]|uniref:Zn(2)-C6 fungal-type domain-containing protein n=1 Tax=Aspergillus bertholletiae TaxID=1226010 RepID=A0A5N7ARY1_9EURO|nr:hypothetical protein BDV26DRAFT_286617 [Aspergillus bertholletiae]
MSSSQQEKGDQDGTTQKKTRAPYIQRACIECKRRKQRCSGHDPCKNCEGRAVRCNYGMGDSPPNHTKNSTDCLKTVASQVQSLSCLVESMQAEIQSLKEVTGTGQTGKVGGSLRDTQEAYEGRQSKRRKLSQPITLVVSPPPVQGPRYQGLTSAEYSLKLTSLKLAQLQNPMGTKPSNLDACYDRGEAKDASKVLGNTAQLSQVNSQARSEQVSVQVFTELSHSRARELVILYSDVVGSLHPIVDISTVLDCVDQLYARLRETRKNSEKQTGRYDVIVIRLVLAIALLSEQNQNAALIESCYEEVEQELNSILCSETVSLRGVILVLMGAIYHLFSSRMRMAWRLCGISASLAVGLGLHRPETLQKAFPKEQERLKAVRIMWSIFVLDHGWSAALGLPRNIDDAAFDGFQLVPEDSPYLGAMASYCAISTKIVNATSKIPVNTQVYEEEQFQFLNYQIDRWQQTALDGLVISPSGWHSMPCDPPDAVSALLYLRANQLRILLLRPLFFTESIVKPDQAKISSSLQIAIQTISMIYHLNATTDIYCKQHPFFSHFLTSATSLILLIITYRGNLDISTQRSRMCAPHDVCQPLNQALELISAYSSLSNYSAQLHRHLLSIVGLLSRLEILSLDVDAGEATELQPPPEIGSQHQECIPDMVPFYQADHQQMDSFLNGTIWNELDKLLTSRLNSVEPLVESGDSKAEYCVMCDEAL